MREGVYMNTPVATYDPESRALYIYLKQSEGSVKTEVLKENQVKSLESK